MGQMGVTEETGKAVGVHRCIGQRAVIAGAVVIIVGVVFILVLMAAIIARERSKSVFEYKKEVREILSQCMVPRKCAGRLREPRRHTAQSMAAASVPASARSG